MSSNLSRMKGFEMTKRSLLRVALAAVFFTFTLASAQAADWSNWRGPNHNGTTDASNLPTEFSASKNLAWTVDMPGVSSATPIIAGGRVYVVTNDATQTKVSGMCIDAASGKVLWTRQFVSDGAANARNDMASCSPVSDGEHVYFMFGNSELFAVDKDGKDLWSRNLGKDFGSVKTNWGYSSSPLLYKGRLYVQVLRGEWDTDLGMKNHTDSGCYVVCFDPATGDTIWKIHRPTDANGESFDAYTSPVPYEGGEEAVLAVMGGDYITGHDLDTGEELWRHFHNPRQGQFDRLIPSPVVADKLVVGLQPRGVDAFAFNPADGKNLKYEDSAWIFDDPTSDVPTPAYYNGLLFIVNGARKQLLCLDPKTGKPHYYEGLGADSRIWASPTVADGKLYALTEKGQVVIAAATDQFKVINRIDLGSSKPAKSSIAIANDHLFIRTADKLYCVGGTIAAE